ncbi:MAG: regulatory signaling modulator protein AmpE [Candidatus Thiodiazotropha endolucinida]
MSLTIILICLIAERFLLGYGELRDNGWFTTYCQWFERHQLPQRMRQGVIGVLLLILPPVLALSILQHLFEDALFGLLWFALSVAILLYCLGPNDLDSQVNRYIEAVDSDEDDEIRASAASLIKDEPPTSEPARSQAVAEGVLAQANQSLFSVLFWFILLGPIGSMAYRIATWLPKMEQANQDPDFHLNSKQLVTILDWIPARLTAFCYAIAGSFEDALYGWRSYHENRFSEFADSNSGTLICTGGGAMRLSTLINEANEGVQSFSFLAKAAMALVWRSLVVYLVIVALLTFSGLV